MSLEAKTKDVLNICSYYETIVNYQFKEGDILTKYLISVYSREIFNVDSNDMGKTNQLKVIDIVMNEYLTDIKFNRYVKENISFEDVVIEESSLVEHDMLAILIKLYNRYRKRKEEELEQTLWL